MINPGRESDENLAREIRKYNIMSSTYVRGSGSPHSSRRCRCLWDICGKPMIQWALEVPLASKYINKVVLSSEDQDILRFAEKMEGVTIIPRQLDNVFLLPRDWNVGIFQKQRPRSLFSRDTFAAGPFDADETRRTTSPTYYCMWYLQEYHSFITDIEVIAPANEPLATVESLDRLIEAFFKDEEANYAHTLYPIMPYIWTINEKTRRPFPLFFWKGLDRQCYPSIYRQGPFQIHGNASKSSYNSTIKIAYTLISKEEAIDIHDEEDLALANFYMKRRLESRGKK